MYVAFNKQVYHVKGSARSALYDLNNFVLFSVNKPASELLDKVTLTHSKIKDLSFAEQEAVLSLIKKGILVCQRSVENRTIDELKIEYPYSI